jgi:hypothetical protein
MEHDEGEDMSMSTYAKFKTQNEIDLDAIEKYAPKAPDMDDLDTIVEFGVVDKFIDQGSGILLVKPFKAGVIYDLDNIVTLDTKEVIGFILDLVGPITSPLYTIKLYPQFVSGIHKKDL